MTRCGNLAKYSSEQVDSILSKLPINKIILGDCIKGMKKLPANSIDEIVTDPPFGIEFKDRKANYNRTPGLVLKGYKDVNPNNYFLFTTDWLDQAYRVLKPTGTMFLISGFNHIGTIRDVLETTGFHLLNEITWKYQFGVVTKRKFVTSHYNISFVCKNKSKYKFYPNAVFQDHEKTPEGRSKRYADMEDVWIIDREYWTGKQKTPTKLPLQLVVKMLAYSTKRNNIVLDPFMGSGQVAIAAKLMGRRYIGYEIVKEYCEFARKRLRKQ